MYVCVYMYITKPKLSANSSIIDPAAFLIAQRNLSCLLFRAALTDDMAKTVAVSLIHSRIDYVNSLIHGSINVRRLQCIQNSAARVVLRDRPHQSTTALLSELHWLPAQSRITFKIACLVPNL